MFRIPDFHLDPLTFEESAEIMSRRGNGDLLEGMEEMDRIWQDYINSDDQDDDEFFANWCYETNAYNVVYEVMSKLFAPKKETV